MSLNARIAIAITLACLCAIPAFAVTQTPQAWTTNVVAGEFPSEQAALSAVRAQGGVYALAERVESIVQSTSTTTYVYGSNPRGPIIGPWGNYTMQGAEPNPHASEEAAIDVVKAKWDANGANCPIKTTVTPTTGWRQLQVWYSGDNYSEVRDYAVEFSAPPSCVRNVTTSQSLRDRVVECPQYTTWNSTEKACLNKDIARITSRPMVCSSSDLQHNPCNVSTGDKYQAESDFTLPWLDFSRHYHSSHSVPNSALGSGWTHSLNQALQLTDSSTAGLVLPSGNILPFQNSEAVDGSGWKLSISNGMYAIQKPTQILRFQSGRLVQIEDLNGALTSLGYDSTGRLITATNSNGRSISFEYGNGSYSSKKLLSAIKSNGASLVEYGYDSTGRLEFAYYPDATSRHYHYENSNYPNHLTGITDETGQRYSTFAYNANGLVTVSEHAGGQFHGEFSYQPDGKTIFTDPNGRSQTFQFTGDGAYRKVTGISETAGTQSTTYALASADFRRRPISRTDKRGVQTTYSYADVSDPFLGSVRLTTTNEAVGTPQARTSQDWREQTTGRLRKTLAPGTETVYQLNTRGQPISVSAKDTVSATTRTKTMTYCEQTDLTAGTCPLLGLVTSVNGPRTDVADTATYTYYPSDDATCAAAPTTCPHRKGDLWKVTNALGQATETLAYDGAGRVLSVKDANGVITDMEYHPRGWLTARKTRGANASVETDDAITRIEYWPTGLVKKVIQPDGAFTLYTYDAAHRLTDIADNAGNTIHYTLDNAGNRTQEDTKDPGSVLKRTLSRVYNQLGQLQTQADAQANPTDFTYDANGNTNTVTDALSRVTDNDYDPLNRLSRTLQNVGGINAETKFAYDAQDNLTQVTDPKGLNTSHAYNGLGDLTQLVSPDTGTTAYTYDSAGNRKTQTDARNQTSTYSYDALNRLTGIAYATSALNVGYTYDTTQAACIAGETFSTGRLTQLADASGTTQYCYDRFGNLVRKVQTTNGIAFTVRYAYTLAGQLSSVTYPDGAIASYVRDAQGRTTQVNVQRAGAASEVLLNQASYHPFGPVAGWTYSNGRQLLRPLNQNYQPTAVQDTSAGGLSVGFAYDPVGNLTQLTPAASSTPLVKFDYDALSRLTTFKDGPTDVAIETYAYDATGNRQSFTNSAGTQAYTYPSTSHRLSQVGATVRSYDNAGNTTAIDGTAKEFVYDDTGRMSQVKQNAVVQRNYAYNGKGEQVRKYLGATSTYTVFDEAGHWLGDYDNTGAALQQAIWLDDLPVGLIANGNQLHYIEPDHLGTPRVVIEVARNVPVWTWDLKSEAFGNSVPAQDPDGDSNPLVFDMRFPGQQYDATSGLNQNGNRDYDPAIGRYPKSDPLGLRGGISTYSYAYSNPLMWIDPDGLQVVPVIPMGPGATGAAGAAGVAGAYNPNNPNDPNNLGDVGPKISVEDVALASQLTPGLMNMVNPNSALWLLTGALIQEACRDDDEDDCSKILDSSLLRAAGIKGREHEVKADELGTNKNLSKFDLCGCKDGRVVVKAHGCRGPIISITGYRWK